MVNLNDTDGDSKVDNGDDEVKDEKDLMKLILRKPEPDLGGKVTLKIVSGNVTLWKLPTKPKASEEKGREFNTNKLPMELWVEATDVSGKVRDIEIQMEYQGIVDTVKATGVSAQKTGFKNRLTDALWGDAGDPLKTTFTGTYGGKFGIQYAAAPVGVQYAMGMEFTVLPSGVGSEPGVMFDVTRQKEARVWGIQGATVSELVSHFWPGRAAFTGAGPTGVDVDKSNDDGGDTDEDNTPDKDRIYSIDGPGHSNDGAFSQLIFRANFLEFVRVKFDGARPTGSGTSGSRCSSKIPWYAHFWSEKAGAVYRERAGKGSAVEEGYKEILPAPVP